MTPKTIRMPRGHGKSTNVLASIASLLGLGGGNAQVARQTTDDYYEKLSFQGQGKSNGAPHVTYMNQNNRRKMNRRSGIYRKRRAKS